MRLLIARVNNREHSININSHGFIPEKITYLIAFG